MAYETKSRGEQGERKEIPRCLVVAEEGRRLMEEEMESAAEKRFRLALSMHPNGLEQFSGSAQTMNGAGS